MVRGEGGEGWSDRIVVGGGGEEGEVERGG